MSKDNRGKKVNKVMHKLYTTVPNKGRTLIHERADEIDLCGPLPSYNIVPLDCVNPVVISGPYDKETASYEFTRSFGSSINTYPHYPSQSSRRGDPICDSYRIHTYSDGVIACLADGCNWGQLPKEASNRAKDAFVYFMEQQMPSVTNVQEIGPLLVDALSIANHAISYDKKDDIFSGTGTTTLLGGVLCKINDPQCDSDFMWVCISIGDCKALHYDKVHTTTVDISAGNRNNLSDARDPGGRIGPYINDGDPDLRNLGIYVSYCNEGDIMMIVSDGVHDNLDPQAIGMTPRDFDLDYDSWHDVPYDEGIDLKIEWTNNFLTDMVRKESGEAISPKLLTKKLLRHCIDMTAAGRQFMEQNPNSTLPSDYQLYPGKMDHTTCVAFKVGSYDPSETEEDTTESLNTDIWPY
eukprot:TRINITY_DN9655_c0_g1_i1.p1 TRINITY_DN9655_c0_g1~~TRINITY_DN9655_c0_g1_i1.p1  ORF type:complete len:409 (-),score=83.19 TRINITY_DN9655_c0_g1_i1:20-1246(-)